LIGQKGEASVGTIIAGRAGRQILRLACAIFVLAIGTTIVHAAASKNITQAELVRRTQELFDAVAGGDQAPCKLCFADDAMFLTRRGGTWIRLC
jgi:hypothetical protein